MIDWARVRELRDEIGNEDFPEVVEIFLEEAEEVVERLNTGPDRSALEQDLHFLKGSALSFGFSDLSDLCQDGERKSASGQADQVDVNKVVAGYYAARDHFLQEMPTQLTP